MTKKMFVIQAIAFVLVCCAMPFLLACDSGCEEHGGVCACDIPSEKLKASEELQPSSEEPSRHPQAAWQRGEVVADMPRSSAAQDILADEARAKAEVEGKKAAGIEIKP